jgi:rhodanese-related sulfurtransferase
MSAQSEFFKVKLENETDSSDLMEAIRNKEALIIIDTRSTATYEVELIPGALSFPHRTMNKESTAKLDRSLTYITYCDI